MPASPPFCLTEDQTIYHALDHKEVLLDALSTSDALLLDLAQVEAIDSAGLQLLILLEREAQCAGKSLRIVAHSAAIGEVVALCNLADRVALGDAPPAAAEIAA